MNIQTTGQPAGQPITPFHWMKATQATPRGTRRDFVNPDDIPWTDWLMPGTRFKLLFADLATGRWTMLLQVDPGTQATLHWHVHMVEAYILEGGFYYDADDQGRPNTYTCERAGHIHEPFAPDGCLMVAIAHGPIGGYMPDGTLALVADARLHYELAKQNNATALTTVVDFAPD